MRAVLLFLICLLLIPAAFARPPKEGERVRVRISKIRPTQKFVGYKEIEVREATKFGPFIENGEVVDPNGLEKFLQKDANVKDAVLGPEGKIYLIDGHHFVRAAWNLGVEKVYVNIKHDWSQDEDGEDISKKDFWKKMSDHHFVYLLDKYGNTIKPKDLPKTVSELTDNRYRSLAWFVRNRDGYRKGERLEDKIFPENRWGLRLLQLGIVLNSNEDADFEVAILQALTLVHEPVCNDLPGFIPLAVAHSSECSALLDER